MSLTDLPMLWPQQPGLSLIVWLLLIMALLFFARIPAHHGIRAFARVVHGAMRLTARSITLAANRLEQRNREVLFAAGKEAAERAVVQEFGRVETVIERDLAGFPSIYRALNEQVARMEQDYSSTSQLPPVPEAWVRAVEAVANIPSKGDSMVGEVLEEIHGSLVKAQDRAMEDYRVTSHERHRLLRRMLPAWRKVNETLGTLNRHVKDLHDRSKVIDVELERYQQLAHQTEAAERQLADSSFTQFFISAFVLVIAIFGAVVNFNLIDYPMQEMVGGNSYIGGFKTSSIAALVIIMVEVAMGLFLMESLRITRLFPIIGTMDDKMRRRMVWITFSILFILATVESSLAYMRELMAADRQLLTQTLAQVEVAGDNVSHRWIPTLGQMVMGFILPFALVFAAIPLESFVHSSRTVLGLLGVLALRALAFLTRLVGSVIWRLARGTIYVYDLLIFVPLWVEHTVRAAGARNNKEGLEAEPSAGKS